MGKKLAANVNLDGVLYEAGSEPPKDIAEQITNPNAWAADEADDDAPTGYRAQSADELKALIDARNEGRDDADKVSKRGGVDKLAEALEADDARLAADAAGA